MVHMHSTRVQFRKLMMVVISSSFWKICTKFWLSVDFFYEVLEKKSKKSKEEHACNLQYILFHSLILKLTVCKKERSKLWNKDMAAKLYITQIQKTFRLVWFWSGDQLEKTPYTWGLEPSSKNFLGHQGLYETTNQNNFKLNLNFWDWYVITKDASQSFDQTSLFYMTKITVLIISHLSFIFQIIFFWFVNPW